MTDDEQTITIRRATLADVPAMMPLLDAYAKQAEILPRTAEDVYRTIREWVVADSGELIVGMGALLIVWRDLAEVRSLAVDPGCHGQGVGRRIVEQLLVDAQALDLKRVFALTRSPGFFLKLGFELTQIERLPRKVKRDCVFCPKFHRCDEVAVIMPLKDEPLDDDALVPVDLAGMRNGDGENQAIIPLATSLAASH